MTIAFGIWLKNYEGDEVWLRKLSASWTRALGDDYLRPMHYRRAEDVINLLQHRVSRKPQMTCDVMRAWFRYAQSDRST